jgi:branched-chain amino acid aminotransferase
MRLARERGIEVRECAIPRELLYVADEAFFTGTAVEITPIRSVDRIMVGAGKRGPITETLQKAFFGLFSGETPDQWGWLDHVDMAAPPAAAAR